jgi:hypothetical protein
MTDTITYHECRDCQGEIVHYEDNGPWEGGNEGCRNCQPTKVTTGGTCDYCQKDKYVEQTDYGRLCYRCFRQAEYDHNQETGQGGIW